MVYSFRPVRSSPRGECIAYCMPVSGPFAPVISSLTLHVYI